MKLSQKYPKVCEFLKQHYTGVLSTVMADGQPWGSAIYFVIDDDFSIYFVTRQKTLKYQNIESNPHAALTVVDPSTQTTMQLTGKISKVPAADYMEVVFNKLAALKPKNDADWVPPLMKIHEGDYMPLKLTPSKMQFANFSEQTKDYDQKFIEQII